MARRSDGTGGGWGASGSEWAREGLGVGPATELPAVVYVEDFAALLRITPAALRRRAARGQVPAPRRIARALAWLREDVLKWLRECGRSAGSVEMKITLRPYAKDKNRWHVDIRFMHPQDPQHEIRRRVVAPAGLAEKQARAWAERQVPLILREVLGEGSAAIETGGDGEEVPRTSTSTRMRGEAGAGPSPRTRSAASREPLEAELRRSARSRMPMVRTEAASVVVERPLRGWAAKAAREAASEPRSAEPERSVMSRRSTVVGEAASEARSAEPEMSARSRRSMAKREVASEPRRAEPERSARSWRSTAKREAASELPGARGAWEAGGGAEPASRAIRPGAAATGLGPAVTLAEFYEARFLPEHVLLQKPATQDYYDKAWRCHIGPLLGAVPVQAIDDDVMLRFRAQLGRRLSGSTANIVLAKVARMLRFARKVRLIEARPEIERLPEARKRPKKVYDAATIDRLVAAAWTIGPEAALVCLLALDAGLRVSEICGLEWGDVDLAEGSLVIQHNDYRGVSQTPKGNIGKVALTSGLRAALAAVREAGVHGPRVLYRRSHYTGQAWAPHTTGSVKTLLHKVQRQAGLPPSGPHLLRHTALTRLANLGASAYVVQAVARHSRLQTTQSYLHTQQAGLAREAALLIDRAQRADFGNGFGNDLGNAGNSVRNGV